MKYRIGVDVGGTNTDAVIISEKNEVIAKTKTFTTLDIISGISKAINEVVVESKIDTSNVSHAMLGTTQCTNAIVERKNLDKVITLRLAGPATHTIAPYCNWPEDVKTAINKDYYIVDGGYEYDGSVLCPINEREIIDIVNKYKDDCHNYAISCVFAPVDSSQENTVRDLILEHDKDANISISSEIGSLSLLERENATILNAALSTVIKNVVHGFKSALASDNITTDAVYLCQNDGTLMDAEYALKFPVLTIASGPTNSIRGGIYLTNQANGIILDVGGTTSDIGVVVNGFPRETTIESEVGGVSTNFRMPDIVSIAIGGGTIIKEVDDKIIIGPESVGYELSSRALVFGGDTITLSDVAIKLGYADFGDKSKLDCISTEFATKVMDQVKKEIEEAIDLVRISNEKDSLIIVGGGSTIVPKDYDNVSEVLRPVNQDIANAIGASIAKISGTFEGLVSFSKQSRDKIIEDAKNIAGENALNAGALANTLEVVEVEEYPIAYHPEQAVKLRVKVVGELSV